MERGVRCPDSVFLPGKEDHHVPLFDHVYTKHMYVNSQLRGVEIPVVVTITS